MAIAKEIIEAKNVNGYNKQDPNKNLFAKMIGYRINEIPVPIYIVLAAIIFFAAAKGVLPKDLIGGFALITVMGFVLSIIGASIPGLKNVGGPAILTLFIPSAMVYYGWLNQNAVESITMLMKTSNFLYLFIAILVCGSILGMNRKVMIKGFVSMFVPLIVGTLAAIAGGILVGLLFGYTPYKSFFNVIVPIIAGGIGEGILPLSLGYSEVIKVSQDTLIAQLVPAAMIGNVTAVITAGILARMGQKKPHLTGNGQLVKAGDDADILNADKEENKSYDVKLLGAGLLLACTLFVFGTLVSPYIGIPGAIIMIFTAALVKYFKLLPKHLEDGVKQLYKIASGMLTYAVMVGLGTVYMNWGNLVSTFSIGFVSICVASVVCMSVSGFYIGKLMKMYPVEASLVTTCHSGLGGTGDIAILTASNRMELMPFAQVSTRIGGATTVVLAVILLRMFS